MSAGVVTLGAPLVPVVQTRFDLSETASQWSYTITLLVGATLTPVLGRLADGRRRRPAAVCVCALVAVGCGLSAVADGYPVFLAGRAAQGLGVGLVALAIATARDHVPGSRGVRLLALLSVTTALGAGLSYPLTMVVAEQWGLAAAYGGAGVLTAGVAVALAIGMPRTVDASRRTGLDLPGAVLLTAGSLAVLLAISQGGVWGWTDPRTLGCAVAGVMALAVWVAVELHVRFPLVELRLVRQRDVLAAHLTAVAMGVSLYSTPVLVSRMAQAPSATGYGSGLGLLVVGLVMTPIAAGNLAGNRLALVLARRLGSRGALATGGAVAAAGPLVLVFVPGGALWTLLLAMALSAFGAGATFGTMTTMIVGAVEPAETGSATSVNILLRLVGGALGSAATGAALAAHPGPVAGFASASGLRFACLLCAAGCAVAVVVSLVLARRRTSPTPTD
ncbi:MFS transporter [Pseudonocardia petroleophila]